TTGGAIFERPITVSTHAASDIEKALAAPVICRQWRRPPPKLLFVLGQYFGIGTPFISKPLRRAFEIIACPVSHSRRPSGAVEQRVILYCSCRLAPPTSRNRVQDVECPQLFAVICVALRMFREQCLDRLASEPRSHCIVSGHQHILAPGPEQGSDKSADR